MIHEDSTPHNPSLLVTVLRDEGFSILEIGEMMDHSLEWVLQHLISED